MSLFHAVLDVSLDEPEEQLSARLLAILSTHVHNWRALAEELGVQDMEDIAKQCHGKECFCIPYSGKIWWSLYLANSKYWRFQFGDSLTARDVSMGVA